MKAAFTQGAKVSVTASASLNLVLKHPLTGNPMVPFRIEVSSSSEVNVIPAFTFNDGSISGGEFEWSAALTESIGVLVNPASSFTKTVVEGDMKSVTFVAATAVVYVTAYYSGLEHQKPL